MIYNSLRRRLFIFSCFWFGSLLLGAACGKVPTPVVNSTGTAPLPPLAGSSTSLRPTPTSPPLAASVNGENITLDEYQAELARYKSALGTELATEDKQKVLNDLIDQLLLAQMAREKGFIVDEKVVQERVIQLNTRLGNEQVLKDWMSAQGYTDENFRHSLARSIAAAWMRDQIIAQVADKVEQVHARQILLTNQDQANEVLSQLRSGKDFVTLVVKYDPVTRGDLGWFPQGYLLDTNLDEAVFKLQPNEYSDVIQTSAGYHIIQVVARDPARVLEAEIRLILQEQALQKWLEARRAQSQINIVTPQ